MNENLADDVNWADRVARELVADARMGFLFYDRAVELARMCGPSFGGQRMRQCYMYARGYLDARKEPQA